MNKYSVDCSGFADIRTLSLLIKFWVNLEWHLICYTGGWIPKISYIWPFLLFTLDVHWIAMGYQRPEKGMGESRYGLNVPSVTYYLGSWKWILDTENHRGKSFTTNAVPNLQHCFPSAKAILFSFSLYKKTFLFCSLFYISTVETILFSFYIWDAYTYWRAAVVQCWELISLEKYSAGSVLRHVLLTFCVVKRVADQMFSRNLQGDRRMIAVF